MIGDDASIGCRVSQVDGIQGDLRYTHLRHRKAGGDERSLLRERPCSAEPGTDGKQSRPPLELLVVLGVDMLGDDRGASWIKHILSNANGRILDGIGAD